MSDQKQMSSMPQPGPEHERFKPFVGTFRAVVKLWMGPGDPMVTEGTMVNTLDLGGMYLREDFTGDSGEGPFPGFEGRGFWGYNPGKRQCEGFWIDNASSIMQVEHGSVDDTGKVWTMEGEMPDPTGKMMKKRSVITLQDNDHHSMEMFFEVGGQEIKGMEITYTRSG